MVKSRMYLICFVAGLLLCCHSACRGADKNPLAVLSDFTFAGSGQAKFNDDRSIDTTYRIPHDENEQPKPQNLTQGVQYVFHHRAPVDDESLALKVLPEKLTMMGFKITKAPKSTSDLMYLYLGGPLFYIKFSDGNREFAIFNQLATSHSDTWAIHDYNVIRIR